MAGGELKRGALLSYLAIAFNTLAGLLYTPWMVDCIGSTDYGLYTLAMSIINFFMLDFGLGNAVSRFLSKYYAEGDVERANLFLGVVYKMYAVIASIIFLIFVLIYCSIDAIYSNLPPSELLVFKRLFVIAALYSVISFTFISFDGVLVSNERFVAINAVNLIQKMATVALIIGALLYGAGVYALVAVNAVVGLLSILIKYLLIKKLTCAKPRLSYFDVSLAKEIVNFSIWVLVAQICQRFIFSIMPTVIAIFSSAREISIFGLAVSLEGYVWTVANALNGLMMPSVSKVIASGETSKLQALMERVGRIQVYIIGLIIIGFLSTGRLFVKCWMGDGYESLYFCTLLIIVPSLFELPQLVAGTAIIAVGEVKRKAQVFLLMAATNIALSVVLVAQFGALGASLSICIAYLARTAGMCRLYRSILHINLSSFFKASYARWIIPACISCALGLALAWSNFAEGWLAFLCSAIVVCIAYFVGCYMYSFDAYERDLVKRLLRRPTKAAN